MVFRGYGEGYRHVTEHLTAAQFQQLAKPDKRARKAKELSLHVAAVQYIEAMIPNCLGYHIPNGERRDKKTGAKLKRMGAKAGVADYCLPYGGGRTVYFEFKAEGGKTSKKQKEWIQRMRDFGHKVAVIYEIEDIRNTFKALGIITRESV